jgi:hypothetical protein
MLAQFNENQRNLAKSEFPLVCIATAPKTSRLINFLLGNLTETVSNSKSWRNHMPDYDESSSSYGFKVKMVTY